MFNKLKLPINRLIGSKYSILIVLVIALGMRLVVLNQSLWLDEAIGAYAVKNFTYRALLGEFMKFDFHPPLYYLLLKLWTGIFGYSEVSLRLPSILFGLGTIWLAYCIAGTVVMKKDSKIFAILSAIILATSQFHIYYSQEARMYCLAAFFAVLTIYLLIQLLKEKIKIFQLIAFSFSLPIMLFSDYMPIFLLPVLILSPLIYKKDRSWWLKYASAFIPLIILGAIWLPTFLVQSVAGREMMESLPAWRAIIGGSNIKQLALVWMKFVFGRISLANKSLYYLLVVFASMPFLLTFINLLKIRNKIIYIIILWLTIPLGLGFLVSFLFPAFNYFRYVYVVPAFYLLVSWGALGIRQRNIKLVVISSLIVLNIISWLIYVFDTKQHREQWKQAVSFIEGSAGELDVVIFEYPRPFTPYRWYSKGLVDSFGITDAVASDEVKIKQKTQKAIQGRRGVYYFEYLADLADPGGAAEMILENSGYKVDKVYNFNGVGQVFYWTK